jgi:hypothetical protein
MRKTGTLLLLAFLAHAGEGGLLKNGGFEEGQTGWVFFQLEAADRVELDEKNKTEGKCAIHVTKSSATVGMFWTDYALGPDQQEGTLSFSARVRGKNLVGANVSFVIWDASGETAVSEMEEIDGTFKWKTFEKTIDIPGPAMGGRVLVRLRRGEIWVDEVSVVLAGAAEAPKEAKESPGVQNGDFARGKGGWASLPGSEAAVEKGALHLERKGDRLFPAHGVEQIVKMPGRGRKATLRCRARSDGRAFVAISAETKDGALVEYAWREVRAADFEEVALPLPVAAARLRITLGILGPGNAWFDDVLLEDK